jgi:hypothetical protein
VTDPTEPDASGLLPVARYAQFLDEQHDLADNDRGDRLATLVAEVFANAGAAGRPVPSILGLAAACLMRIDGVQYLLETWGRDPVEAGQVDELTRAAATRPTVMLVLLSMAGYAPGVVEKLQAAGHTGVVLLDGQHVEAMLGELIGPIELLAEVAERAQFHNQPHTGVTELLTSGTLREPPVFVTPDRLPPPWPLLDEAAPGTLVQHLLSGVVPWPDTWGYTAAGRDRGLITVPDGILDLDLKRGSTNWLVPVRGCRGNPLLAADGAILTMCGGAVIRWKDEMLTLIGGGFADALALLPGPSGEPWMLSGSGAAGTLTLTRLGDTLGAQHPHRVEFGAVVHTAGWLDGLRFFLAASGHSAVVDLARSTLVRREDWIETPHHHPAHIVVADPHTVITASPSGRGLGATLYRTDTTTRASEIVADIPTNRVNGLTIDTDGRLVLLGDVRGNDLMTPHPVLIAIHPPRPSPRPASPAATPTPHSSATQAPRRPSPASATVMAAHDPVTVPTETPDPYDPVRLSARGDRGDYALDHRPINRGGQAIVFGATHKPSGIRVALKRLQVTNRDTTARMRREVDAAQRFGNHPNVMPILDYSPGHDWFVMPLADDTAQTVAPELANEATLRDLVTAVCEALREPHALGWIHRDLKPDNILRISGQWLVADWGLGRRPRGQTTDPQRTRTGGVFGTEGFAAPELSVNAHTVPAQTDIYAIGQIIGWALTGQWPLANVPLLPPRGPWLAPAEAATRWNIEDRPATVDELLALIPTDPGMPLTTTTEEQ